MPHSPDINADRRTGIIVGILFIVATAFLFLGEAFYKSYIDAEDALAIVAVNKPVVVLGLGIELICILSMPLIGAFIYPVLRRVSAGMALTYFFLRGLEGVILITVAQTNKWAVLTLSEAYVAGSDPATLEASLTLIRAQNVWGDTAGSLYNLIFVAGAICLYAVLFRARLVPLWISVWGLLAIAVLAVIVVFGLFAPELPDWVPLLVIPIAVQEMVMALWFIFRGFDFSVVDTVQMEGTP